MIDFDKQYNRIDDVNYPRIYLAIDNCFASKRYTEPNDWAKLIRDLGIFYIEASADTECDPLYMGKSYLKRWIEDTQNAIKKFGISICNLYSGHGTYSTLGIAHTDPQVTDRILNGWFKPMIGAAAALNAGLGFYCHAFNNKILQNPNIYKEYKNKLIKNLIKIVQYSHFAGCKEVGLEQMYSPHQIPWTIECTKELIQMVCEKSKKPLYITIDTGHQTGQINFLKPNKTILLRAIEQYQKEGYISHIWLGSDSAYELFEKCKYIEKSNFENIIKKIYDDIDKYPYLFAEMVDCSTYKWLEELACYSPIIHLQQTDGMQSWHWPFTKIKNKIGLIEGRKVLEAIKVSYQNQQNLCIPKVDKIYLTIEVFLSTGSINYYALKELEETVRYWRQYVPEDGKKLNELL
jgi:D-erythrulose 1-phosphate 3-epimerase